MAENSNIINTEIKPYKGKTNQYSLPFSETLFVPMDIKFHLLLSPLTEMEISSVYWVFDC